MRLGREKVFYLISCLSSKYTKNISKKPERRLKNYKNKIFGASITSRLRRFCDNSKYTKFGGDWQRINATRLSRFRKISCDLLSDLFFAIFKHNCGYIFAS